ncbi:MAG: cytochrome c oxidase subunit II [Alphaproteobacteria bacterium]|nr:cytochrome c oxidase subunit II [Alphaproteobacteria bacterium]
MTAWRNLLAPMALLGTTAISLSAQADHGMAHPWQLGLQTPVTPVAVQINDFHNLLMIVITVIAVFVTLLLLYVLVRFSAKNNPTPTTTTHNTLLEVLWTAIPIVILVVIVIPSLKLLYFADSTKDAEMTLKAIGHQWYWSYEYPDHGDFTFDAAMLDDDEREPGQPRLLATDEAVVMPVNTNIRLLIAANDVLHAWAIPAFGVKLDAVPGRLGETWVRVEKEGTYYGQCSELCGTGHGFMPIMVKVVSKEAFAAWVKMAKEEYAARDEKSSVKLAAAKVGTAQ